MKSIIKIISWSLLGVALLVYLAGCTAPGTPVASPPATLVPASPASSLLTPVLQSPSPDISVQPLPTLAPSTTPVLPEDTPEPKVAAVRSDSPYGPWQALVLVITPLDALGRPAGDMYRVEVRLHNLSGGETVTVLDETRPSGLGATYPVVLGWSKDGESLFLADYGVPDGCGGPFKENLQRVGLPVGGRNPLKGDFGRNPSLSQDGQWLGWVEAGSLWLAEVGGSLRRQIALPLADSPNWNGEVSWSPDGAALLLTVWQDPCSAAGKYDQVLYLVFLKSEQVIPINLETVGQLRVLSWPELAYALLADNQDSQYWLEVAAASLSPDPPPDWAAASMALQAYFSALSEQRYAEADTLYGADLGVLQANNPDISADDRETLWQRACQENGFLCMPIREILPVAKPAADRYRFEVKFTLEGDLFVLGPCCGASAIDMPPQDTFSYTVARTSAGDYVVLELPPYVP